MEAVFCNLSMKRYAITFAVFCLLEYVRILLSLDLAPIQGEHYTTALIPGCEDHWGPYQKLPTIATVIYYNFYCVPKGF